MTTKPKTIKSGTFVKWLRKTGEKAEGIVKGKPVLKANGLWLPVKVEGQKTLNLIRPSQVTNL